MDDGEYPSVEHAYQAEKTSDPIERRAIRLAPTPAHAKKFGKKIAIKPTWNDDRVGVMAELIQRKFSDGSDLAARLVATGRAMLIEGNWWHDTFWGVCKGKGENWLGVLLMQRRKELGGHGDPRLEPDDQDEVETESMPTRLKDEVQTSMRHRISPDLVVEWDVCDWPCHSDPQMHVMPCCETCSGCGNRIPTGLIEQHEKRCPGLDQHDDEEVDNQQDA